MTASVLARAPVTFSVLDTGTTHAPMLFASIGGTEAARYVLDTGSDVHLLSEDLADELGLDKQPGEEGTDHSGATMPSWNVGDISMNLGGLELSLRDVVAIPAPPPFPGHGIRGILSPQNFHPTAWAIIDMVKDELLLVEGTDSEVADLLRTRSPELSLLQLPRHADFPSVVVPATLEAFEEMPTLLNTGGKGSEYSASALAGMASRSSERLGGGVSGADYVGWSVGPQSVVLDGHRVAIPALKVRQEMHDPQGMVGMDVLRGTVLACAADVGRPVFWQVPSPRD